MCSTITGSNPTKHVEIGMSLLKFRIVIAVVALQVSKKKEKEIKACV